ncbi:LysR family transcriptional regulator [Sinorhizobium terangae]|uniref:LysR family transcriptional regulator n=1 Tax=Sinorhizobium terangae TaxID=110322 RepID=A0A6N7LNT1_SINTE|nr:LysR family transcriptional regulator [Sinorhizobium terangae]MBB4185808.1 DNA-binding transcriptional LysR family regulator [Sinorhizobium terangae]MQX19397.1 LysR family transcriptional regulator [Sinorhizobium terangae]WFU46864.1 LysR family transcriptional regulator [Sinorhizobium terangae]
MQDDHLSWDDLRLLKAVAEGGSVARGAHALGIDNSTGFRRIARLEASLGVKLFERHRKGYELTQEGAEIFALSMRMQRDVQATSLKIAGADQSPVGHIRIATNDTIMSRFLAGIFASFQSRFPGMSLEVVTGNVSLNLSQRDCDVAIRATNRPPENLVGRRLATIGWAPYRRVSESHGAEDPFEGRWISFAGELSDLAAARYLATRVAPHQIAFSANSTEAVFAAVCAGIGAAYLPCYLGDNTPDLERLTPPEGSLASALWILTHPELKRAKRVRQFIDHCVGALLPLRATMEGLPGR